MRSGGDGKLSEFINFYRPIARIAVNLFGFFITANALALADREIVVGLLAGLVGGLTMLLAVMWQERSARTTANLLRTAR